MKLNMAEKPKAWRNQRSFTVSSATSSHSSSDPNCSLRWLQGKPIENSLHISELKRKPSKKGVLESEESSKCEISGVSAAEDQEPNIGVNNSTPRKKRKSENESLRFSTRRKIKKLKKRKEKATILSWLIDTNTIQENAEIFSVDEASKKIKNKGIIQREGILCFCCNKCFTVANFHVHGGSNCEKPYESIVFARTNISLMLYMIKAWNKPEESKHHKPNIIETKRYAGDLYDDACMVCADGGNLMCCEGCNSTYHQVCIGMEDVPEGSWYCPYCVCKFCTNPAHENDYLLTCPQCEKRYHWECHQKKDRRKIDLNSTPLAPFCEPSCEEVYKLMENMVGKRNEIDEGYSWTLLHRMDGDFGMYIDDKYLRTMCHCKLAVARELMEDCFEPIQDRHTRVKIIPSVVYNCRANFKRVDFRGFYTAVVEKDDEIISVASLRVHGTKLAEMPFIATSEEHRCKGMCRKLMVAIESALCYLKVKSLILPSVPERIGNWIKKYGFSLLETSMKKEIMVHNTIMFHDSVRLQKVLVSSNYTTWRTPPCESLPLYSTNAQGIKQHDVRLTVTDKTDVRLTVTDKTRMSVRFDLSN